MVATSSARHTADQYLALDLPERHTQLVNGEIVVTEANLRHQRILLWLLRKICDWCDAEQGRGEAGMPANVRLDDLNVYVPDLWWVSESRRPARDARWILGPPDLAVEVRSPSTWRYDIGTKKRVYEAAGLPELWLVDTQADVVLVFRRSAPGSAVFDVEVELAAGDTLTTPLLPGLEVDVAELFER